MTFSEKQIEWIQVKNIDVVWAEAQRGYNEAAARRIADNLDPDAFGACVVTRPNGKGIYHCVDGQTRIGAVRMLWGEDERVPCVVVNAKDPSRAAQIFDILNSGRRKVSAVDTYLIRVTAEYEVETTVERIVKNLGLRIGHDDNDGTIRAASAVLSVYKQHGSAVLSLTLATIKRAFGPDTKNFDGKTIRGFGMFFAEHRPHADVEHLVKTLSRTAPAQILHLASAKRDVMGGSLSKNICDVLVETHDKGLKHSQRLRK